MRKALAFSVLLCVCGLAAARPECSPGVWKDNCTTPSIQVVGSATNVAFIGPPWTIAISGGVGSFTVSGVGPQNISSISLAGTNGPQIVFGGNINDVGSVSGSAGLRVSGAISRDITGTIVADQIGSPSAFGLFVGRHHNGDIVLTSASPSGSEPQIFGLEVTGDLLGDVLAPGGDIQTVTVGGRIGDPGTPVRIEAKGDIANITAGEINANIEAGAGTTNPANVFRVITTTDNGGSGDFTGSIRATAIANPVNSLLPKEGAFPLVSIARDFGVGGAALIHLDNAVPSATNPPIVIDRTLGANATIRLPANGLQGQLVFNNRLLGGAWQTGAKVELGSGGAQVNLTSST